MPFDETVVFTADRYNVSTVKYPGPDGQIYARDVIRHPGAVVLLPITADNRIVLIHNYRVSLDRYLLEVPAGTMERGELPEVTARRELTEETGYVAGKLEHRRTFYASPGICDEAMHLFVATDLIESRPEREDYEQIENRLATWEEVRSWMQDGSIQDAKTLIALFDYLYK